MKFLTKNGKLVLGQNGTTALIAPEGTFTTQEKNVTPTTEAQEVVPDTGYTAMTNVNVSAVTSAIDENIIAGNIKKDVAILGVTGTYEGESGASQILTGEITPASNTQTIIINNVPSIPKYINICIGKHSASYYNYAITSLGGTSYLTSYSYAENTTFKSTVTYTRANQIQSYNTGSSQFTYNGTTQTLTITIGSGNGENFRSGCPYIYNIVY